MDGQIERRYMQLPEDRLAPFLLGAAGKYAAKAIGKKVAQKYGGQAVDLISKSPTGAAVVNALDEAGLLKQLGVKTPGLKEKLVSALDADIDLGAGVKVKAANLAGWNLGVALQPDLFEEKPLGGPLMQYGRRARIAGLFDEEFRAGAFGDLSGADISLNIQHDRAKLLARTGSNLTLTDGPDELTAEFRLLDTQDGRDALLMLEHRLLRGLSVEFRVQPGGEAWESGARIIHRAELTGLGLVDSPAYAGSLVSERAAALAAQHQPTPAPQPERRTGGQVWL